MSGEWDPSLRNEISQCPLDAPSVLTLIRHGGNPWLYLSQRGHPGPLTLCPGANQDLFSSADVRLDPDTAYSRLIVSEDRKCVRYGDTKQKLPDNPERFYRYNIVLGSQCLSSGRHYWEVEVGDRSEWGLGVCKENVDRKEVVFLSPHYGFWVIRLRKGSEYRAGTDEYPLLSLPVPPRRVGVFLDYEAHDISFYNVTDNGSHIFTFPHYPFPGRLLPYFSPCYSIGANNTAPLAICSLDGED